MEPSCPSADQHTHQLGVIYKRKEHPFDLCVQVINKNLKLDWLQYRVLENTSGNQPSVELNSVHRHSLHVLIDMCALSSFWVLAWGLVKIFFHGADVAEECRRVAGCL